MPRNITLSKEAYKKEQVGATIDRSRFIGS